MGPAPQPARPSSEGRAGDETVQVGGPTRRSNGRMAHPLDAERPTAEPPLRAPEARPTPRPRPTPGPRIPSGDRPRPTPRPRAPLDPVDEPNVVVDLVPVEPPVEDEVVDLVEEGLDDVVPPATGPDVWGMVRRAQEGDAEAFGELYDHYVTLVHR